MILLRSLKWNGYSMSESNRGTSQFSNAKRQVSFRDMRPLTTANKQWIYIKVLVSCHNLARLSRWICKLAFPSFRRMLWYGAIQNNTLPFQGNGKKDRLNQTILSMLRTSPENQKSRWNDSLNKVIHAYYCTCDEATGFCHYYLLCGQYPRLLIDHILELSLLLPQNI